MSVGRYPVTVIDAAGLRGQRTRRGTGPGRAGPVHSIAGERLGAVLGRAPADVMAQVDDSLRLPLQL